MNYRYDDGSNTKDLIKKLKLLPRSVKEAAVHPPPNKQQNCFLVLTRALAQVRTNHFGKDFIRENITKAIHVHHDAATSSLMSSPARHSHHLRTTHTHGSPSKHPTTSPVSPSQLDPFISLIPSHRQAHARQAAQVFNSSFHQTSAFSGRHNAASSPQTIAHASHGDNHSRPATSAGNWADKSDDAASKRRAKTPEALRTEILFKRLTQENPAILEKIKSMYFSALLTSSRSAFL